MTPLDSALDLNLLRPLMALLHERHVSRAANAANITQPAMSRSLARLRSSLGDELLVRSGQSYELTPRAELLMLRLGELMPELQRTLHGDPSDSGWRNREYRIAGGDPITSLLTPRLHAILRCEAPGSSLRLGPEPIHTGDDLARGLSDLVLSDGPAPPGLCAEPILDAPWVCVVDATHPFADLSRLDLETWMTGVHVDIAPRLPGATRHPRHPAASREIQLTAPDHAAALASVVGTDLIATLPEPFIQSVNAPATVRVIPAPAELEPVRWLALWHRRTDREPALEWLRTRVREVLARDH